MTDSDLEARLRRAVAALPDGLRDHVLRVETEALALAERHGVDAQRTAFSALGHDLVRHIKGEALLSLARGYGITPDGVEKASPVLVHGPVAARMLARDYGVDDSEVLAGIDCHTTARAGMTPLEQVLFVADKVEPWKLAHQPALEEVKQLADQSLDDAVLRYLDYNLEESIRRGWQVHHRSLEARNQLLSRRPGAEKP
ncbi:MAG TPA: bis(5'-nucleosyl)-tetraphosphatase (symmetrical) YqeK [Dehalococcoidia bacterium]|nr:bis(5'-nucleosyl)-tetraphosphatase (symmetrical) YqeK [Dehalococcoidia bacterium]